MNGWQGMSAQFPKGCSEFRQVPNIGMSQVTGARLFFKPVYIRSVSSDDWRTEHLFKSYTFVWLSPPIRLPPVSSLNIFHMLEEFLHDWSFSVNIEFSCLISRFTRPFSFRTSMEFLSVYILSFTLRNRFSCEDVGQPKLTKMVSVEQHISKHNLT